MEDLTHMQTLINGHGRETLSQHTHTHTHTQTYITCDLWTTLVSYGPSVSTDKDRQVQLSDLF